MGIEERLAEESTESRRVVRQAGHGAGGVGAARVGRCAGRAGDRGFVARGAGRGARTGGRARGSRRGGSRRGGSPPRRGSPRRGEAEARRRGPRRGGGVRGRRAVPDQAAHGGDGAAPGAQRAPRDLGARAARRRGARRCVGSGPAPRRGAAARGSLPPVLDSSRRTTTSRPRCPSTSSRPTCARRSKRALRRGARARPTSGHPSCRRPTRRPSSPPSNGGDRGGDSAAETAPEPTTPLDTTPPAAPTEHFEDTTDVRDPNSLEDALLSSDEVAMEATGEVATGEVATPPTREPRPLRRALRRCARAAHADAAAQREHRRSLRRPAPRAGARRASGSLGPPGRRSPGGARGRAAGRRDSLVEDEPDPPRSSRSPRPARSAAPHLSATRRKRGSTRSSMRSSTSRSTSRSRPRSCRPRASSS